MQADLLTLIAAIKHDGEPRLWNRVFDSSSVVDIATRYYWAAIKDFPPAGTGATRASLVTPVRIRSTSRLNETPPKLPADLADFVANLQKRQNGGYSPAAFPKLKEYRDFASDMLGSAIETVYGTEDDAYSRRLIVLYNGSLLERIFQPVNCPELANCFHLASLTVFEIINHFTRYVVSRQPGGGEVKAFSEHLVHPSFDFFLGLALLSQFRPVETDPDTRLSTIVAKILKKRLTEPKRLTRIRTNLELLDDKEAQQLVEDELGEHNGDRFVYDAWVVSALLHDIGYYFASLWDLHNIITRFDANWNPTFHALELAAGLPVMDLRSKKFRNHLDPLLGMSDFITSDHLAELRTTLRSLAQGPTRSEYTYYLKEGKQLHPFWSAVEIFKRLQNHGAYFTQRQKLLMYVAIDTIYPHQFPSQMEANAFPRNLSKIEADLGDEFLVFRKNPLAFCLYLVDNCQNFSRYQFVAMENVPKPKQALNIPMKDRKLEVLFDKDYKPQNSDILHFRVLIGGEDHSRLHVRNSGLDERIARSNEAEDDYFKDHQDDPYLFYVKLEKQSDGVTIPK